MIKTWAVDDDRSVSQLFAHFPSVRYDSSPTLCVIVACYKYDLESLEKKKIYRFIATLCVIISMISNGRIKGDDV